MEHKKLLKLISLFAVVGFFLGVLSLNLINPTSCTNFDFCRGIVDAVSQPLALFSVFVFILTGILYFLREEIFRSWFHFSKWYIFLSFVAIFLSNSSSHRVFLNPFETELVAWETSCSYFIISIILIIYKSIKLRGK